ncbi:TRAP transporter substrate-binding protein DctP [Chloroflexota bacterium]
MPSTHTRWVKAIKPWCDEVEQRTNGQVKIVPYFSGALSSMADNYASVTTGLADMGECAMVVPVGKWPVIQSFLFCNSPSIVIKDGSTLVWEMYKNTPAFQNELQEAKILFLHACTPQFMFSYKKPITSLSSYRGLKMNVTSPAPTPAKYESLGFVPVNIPMADVYQALTTGVIEGSEGCYELMVARKWGDVLKYTTPVAVTAGTPFYMAINKNTWNELPSNIQKAIEDISGDYAVKKFADYWWATEMENKAIWETTMGGKTNLLSREDLSQIDSLTSVPVSAFVKEMDSKGYQFSEVYNRLVELEKKLGVISSEAYK